MSSTNKIASTRGQHIKAQQGANEASKPAVDDTQLDGNRTNRAYNPIDSVPAVSIRDKLNSDAERYKLPIGQ